MATNLERMQAMMEEIGPDMAEIEAVIQSEDKNWAIQFEDQSIIMLEWAERPDRIVLSNDSRYAVHVFSSHSGPVFNSPSRSSNLTSPS